ncbi:MAG TPA: hypothetical protein PLG59_05540 [bacterium]|nr:hypothetical protein [bacterium]HQO34101.1 hypothetical protein [bacterium]HQQ00536.1 hypothetical protein [bacterium]
MIQPKTIAYCTILVALIVIPDGISGGTETSEQADTDISKRCRIAVAEWAEYVSDPKNIEDPTDSSFESHMKNRYFHAIMDLGVPALESLIGQMKEGNRTPMFLLELAFQRISKRVIKLSPSEFARIGGGRGAFIKWWEKDRAKIGEEFAECYEQWKPLSEGEEKLQAYYRLRGLGVLAMPYAIEKIRDGDNDLLDTIDFWTDKAPEKAFSEHKGEPVSRKDFYLTWWEENKEHWLAKPLRSK